MQPIGVNNLAFAIVAWLICTGIAMAYSVVVEGNTVGAPDPLLTTPGPPPAWPYPTPVRPRRSGCKLRKVKEEPAPAPGHDVYDSSSQESARVSSSYM